jgi:phosphoglycerate dehydrogenase-like enzyme
VRIAVLDDWQGVATELADWSPVGAPEVFRESLSGDALIEALRPFEAVVLMRERTPFPAAVIEALPNLKLIVTTGPRNASIDVAAADRRGVTVCGTGSRLESTAQLTLALMLAGTRGLVSETLSVRAGGWQTGLGRDLDGLTLGVIGLGRIGARVAELARAFGMSALAWSANLTAERCAEAGVGLAPSLDALLEAADVATIHLVLSDRTRGLIGGPQLARMKPGALLVNTSRGPIVEETALAAALREGRITAAIDVYDVEPPPADHPLRDPALIDSGRLIPTPHLGYVSRQTYETFWPGVVEAIAAFEAGAPVRVLQP